MCLNSCYLGKFFFVFFGLLDGVADFGFNYFAVASIFGARAGDDLLEVVFGGDW